MPPEDLVQHLRSFLADRPGIGASGTVGLAVSGGVDSMVLMDLAARARRADPASFPNLVVLHLDHGLRPDSAEDARFVAAEAGIRGLDCELGRVEWDAGRKRRRGSLEALARDARYSWLTAVARRRGLGAVITAQHLDDQGETVLLALARGTALLGLGGMPSERPLVEGQEPKLLRPFLQITRSRLVDQARAAGIRYREDSSNGDLRHRRNLMRKVILPAMAQSRGSSAIPALDDMASRVRRAGARARRLALAILDRRVGPLDLRGDVRRLEMPLAALSDLPLEVSWVVVDEFVRRLTADAPPLSTAVFAELLQARGDEPRTFELRRDLHLDWRGESEALILRVSLQVEAEDRMDSWAARTLPIPGHVPVPGFAFAIESEESRAEDEALSHSPFEQAIPISVIEGALVIRRPEVGERIEAFGLGGSKLVADLLAEAGVEAGDRFRHPVVADDRGILWVPGVRAAERCRVLRSDLPIVRLRRTEAGD